MIGLSLLADNDHHRLIRKVVSPAFSRNVVDAIQAKIEPEVKKLFDELGEPETFDYKAEIANHIPFISITRMVAKFTAPQMIAANTSVSMISRTIALIFFWRAG